MAFESVEGAEEEEGEEGLNKANQPTDATAESVSSGVRGVLYGTRTLTELYSNEKTDDDPHNEPRTELFKVTFVHVPCRKQRLNQINGTQKQTKVNRRNIEVVEYQGTEPT